MSRQENNWKNVTRAQSSGVKEIEKKEGEECEL